MSLRILLALVAAAFFAGCDAGMEIEPTAKSQKPTQGSTNGPQGHDYLSTSLRARASAQRQLGEVQRERKQQVEEEKTFDRPKRADPLP